MARSKTVPVQDPIVRLEQDLGDLKARVQTLEAERPGRKAKPMLAPKQRDVCAIEPDRNSKTCPFSSIYRYQAGCWGKACRFKQSAAYKRRKVNKALRVAAQEETVRKKAAPVKAVPVKAVTKAVAKKAAPSTNGTKKATPVKAAPVKQIARRPSATKAVSKATPTRPPTKSVAKRPTKRVAKVS